MNLVLLIAFSTIWVASEAFLVSKDKKSGKGTISADHKSRNFNILATVISLSVPYVFIFLNRANSNLLVISLGSFLAILGYMFRHWAILTLGKHFRTTIEIDKNQEIVKTGPYKYLRHPSYSGMILFFIGFGLIPGNWLCSIFTPLMIVIVLISCSPMTDQNVKKTAVVKVVIESMTGKENVLSPSHTVLPDRSPEKG